jgi:YesN/AraC family two-component response regulator
MLIHDTLRKQALDIYGQALNCVTFTPRHGIIAILIGVDKHVDNAEEVVHRLSEIYRDWVRNHFSFTISVAISRSRRGYSSMSLSYQEASSLFNYKMMLGNDVTVSSRNIQTANRKPNHGLFQNNKQIAHMVIHGNMDEARSHLDQLVKGIPQQAYKSETALGIFSYLLGELEYMLFEMEINIHEIFEEDIYDNLYTMSTLSHVQAWLSETVFTAIRAHLDSQHISRQKRIVQQVNYYIHELYDTDITLQLAADQIGISISRLSRIFKEETGRTFSESLIHYRMKKAAEFLENTDMLIKDIADKMRYTNVQNFSRIFKQIMGVPPGEYRKQSQDM